jgi:hypothetical protein
MFQFPGFALKPLCIQGKSTWLTPLMITPKNNNSRISGGFPHSDISGSKPIPGSPKLNAGYHVLHRLLLPRHPPNALFALDLIQKKQGRTEVPRLFLAPGFAIQASRSIEPTCQKLYYPNVATAVATDVSSRLGTISF